MGNPGSLHGHGSFTQVKGNGPGKGYAKSPENKFLKILLGMNKTQYI